MISVCNKQFASLRKSGDERRWTEREKDGQRYKIDRGEERERELD